MKLQNCWMDSIQAARCENNKLFIWRLIFYRRRHTIHEDGTTYMLASVEVRTCFTDASLAYVFQCTKSVSQVDLWALQRILTSSRVALDADITPIIYSEFYRCCSYECSWKWNSIHQVIFFDGETLSRQAALVICEGEPTEWTHAPRGELSSSITESIRFLMYSHRTLWMTLTAYVVDHGALASIKPVWYRPKYFIFAQIWERKECHGCTTTLYRHWRNWQVMPFLSLHVTQIQVGVTSSSFLDPFVRAPKLNDCLVWFFSQNVWQSTAN